MQDGNWAKNVFQKKTVKHEIQCASGCKKFGACFHGSCLSILPEDVN